MNESIVKTDVAAATNGNGAFVPTAKLKIAGLVTKRAAVGRGTRTPKGRIIDRQWV